MYPPAGMLGRMPMRGGIMRMMAEHPVAVKNDKEADEFFEYQAKYAINPFRLKDNSNYISLITHNRRRWSHVFPMGRAAKTVDYSLNWKSLTQPAILPLNTDYLPKKEELSTAYTCEDASYNFVATESPFSSLPAAVLELICQRLSHVRCWFGLLYCCWWWWVTNHVDSFPLVHVCAAVGIPIDRQLRPVEVLEHEQVHRDVPTRLVGVHLDDGPSYSRDCR